MSGGPERSVRPEQENTDGNEASPEEGAAPQASRSHGARDRNVAPTDGPAGVGMPALQEQSSERGTARGARPSTPQEFYWRRQAEKLEKELAAARTEREAELGRLTREREEATAKAAEAEWHAKRLSLIAEAGLSAELTELVPQGDPEMVAAYVEKLKPIAEKLARPRPRGLTNTNPPNAAGSDQARLERLAAEASRGDRRALREYAHLRDQVKRRS